METSRRAKYLNAFGVVQYRRRSLRVVSAEPADDAVIQTTETALAGPTNTSEPAKITKPSAQNRPKSADIFETPAVTEGLVQELEQAKADLDVGAQSLAADKLAFGFDLLVWRYARLLVLEFSVVESEQLALKHRLANNILKALWPQDFNGVEVHQHSWPMQGVAADIASATEWLNSLVTGHLHTENSMPIWVMGELGFKMLFPEHADSPEQLSELVGTRTHHQRLSVDLLISPSLKQISESVVAKTQVWQLLKPIR